MDARAGRGDALSGQALLRRAADLFIAEAYYRNKKMKFHLDFETLIAHLDDIRPKRLVLTHMSDNMLAHLDGVA